jgi:hypothetical protein
MAKFSQIWLYFVDNNAMYIDKTRFGANATELFAIFPSNFFGDVNVDSNGESNVDFVSNTINSTKLIIASVLSHNTIFCIVCIFIIIGKSSSKSPWPINLFKISVIEMTIKREIRRIKIAYFLNSFVKR